MLSERSRLSTTPFFSMHIYATRPNYLLSTLLAGFDFDDPIDVFGQLFVTKGGRWYQRRSLPELDKLFEQQKFIVNPEARKKVIYEMDKLAMNDAGFLILHWINVSH